MKRTRLVGGLAVLVLGGLVWALWPSPRDNRPLVVWHTENDPSTHARFSALGEQFRRETGRAVVYEYVPWGQLSKRLFAALDARDENLLPDITHLEPYMAYSLYQDSALVDITDVVARIEKATPVRAQVRDLQLFGGRRYGLAQHVGVSFILYRQDHLDAIGASAPKTWEEFFAVCERLRAQIKTPGYQPVTAPGVSPFFTEIMFNELLNSAGGRILAGSPTTITLDTPEVRTVLETLSRVAEFASPRRFRETEYLQQFRHLAAGEATFVMFAGARAFKALEEREPTASPELYRTLEPPTYDGRTSYTSLDAEPFVVLTRSDSARVELSKRWLSSFFSWEYSEFCASVPIQLMPIFESLDDAYERVPAVTKWQPWYQQAKRLIGAERTIPYFLQQGAPKEVDFLFAFHNRGVIYEMIIDVVNGGDVSAAIAKAQTQATAIVKDSAP